MIALRKLVLAVTTAAVASIIPVPVAGAATPGSLDTAFGTGGVTSLPAGTAGSSFNGVALQSDGEVIAVGASGTALLVERFSPSGSPESKFNAGSGVGRAVVIQPDGKIVVAGYNTSGILVERFNSSGSLDTSFGSGGVVHAVPRGQANAVAIGPNGTVVVAGQVPGEDGFQRIALLRLTASGAPDTSLGPGGVHVVDLGQDSIAKGAAVEGNGDIVLAGSIGPGGHQVIDAFVARVNPSGALDTSFGSRGVSLMFPLSGGANVTFNAVALDPGGAIVVGGGGTTLNQSSAVFERLTCSGTLDHSFAGSGQMLEPSSAFFVTNPYGANAVAVAAGRRVVAAGQVQDSGLAEAGLWGFESSGSLDFAGLRPLGAESNALAVDPAGDLVVAGTNVPAGFLQSAFVARYSGFGGPARGNSTCGGAVAPVSSAPTITRLSQSHRRWGETKPTRKNRRPQGTTFSYTLNVAAKVTFAFTQSAGGRKVNGRCLPQTRANKRKPSCRRTVSRGSIPANGRAGKNTLYFAGGIPHRGKLAPGTYTVAVTATAGGKTSKRQSLTFTIVK